MGRMGTLSELADSILDQAPVAAHSLVLDVGAGTGLLSRAALARGASVVALDLDAAALSRAPGLRVVGDICKAPFHDETFDVAATRSAFVWMAARERAMDEVFRVLKPGAVLVGSESLNDHLELEVEDDDLKRIWEALREAIASLENTMSASSLNSCLEGAGFAEISLEVIDECEDDPYELLINARPPGGPTIAESLVAGGFPPALVEGFADGLRRQAGRFVSRHALFRCHRP